MLDKNNIIDNILDVVKQIIRDEKDEEILLSILDSLVSYLEIGKTNSINKENLFALKLINKDIYDDLISKSYDIKNIKLENKINELGKYLEGLVDENIDMRNRV